MMRFRFLVRGTLNEPDAAPASPAGLGTPSPISASGSLSVVASIPAQASLMTSAGADHKELGRGDTLVYCHGRPTRVTVCNDGTYLCRCGFRGRSVT